MSHERILQYSSTNSTPFHRHPFSNKLDGQVTFWFWSWVHYDTVSNCLLLRRLFICASSSPFTYLIQQIPWIPPTPSTPLINPINLLISSLVKVSFGGLSANMPDKSKIIIIICDHCHDWGSIIRMVSVCWNWESQFEIPACNWWFEFLKLPVRELEKCSFRMLVKHVAPEWSWRCSMIEHQLWNSKFDFETHD